MTRTKTYLWTTYGDAMGAKLPGDQVTLNQIAVAKGITVYPGAGPLYLAKRFRGPRKNDGRRNAQSMCLRANATHCDVYLYQR